jgi:hypothetical protein
MSQEPEITAVGWGFGMCKRWRLWLAGIGLVQLLVIGIEMALLWPMPSEAEQWAERVRTGITPQQRRELASALLFNVGSKSMGYLERYKFPDGSQLSFIYDSYADEIRDVTMRPGEPVPPLTRLRRALARLIPALGE